MKNVTKTKGVQGTHLNEDFSKKARKFVQLRKLGADEKVYPTVRNPT